MRGTLQTQVFKLELRGESTGLCQQWKGANSQLDWDPGLSFCLALPNLSVSALALPVPLLQGLLFHSAHCSRAANGQNKNIISFFSRSSFHVLNEVKISSLLIVTCVMDALLSKQKDDVQEQKCVRKTRQTGKLCKPN